MKTKLMLITTNVRPSMLPNKILHVKITYTYIENVTSHKSLGVIVDKLIQSTGTLTLLLKIETYLPIEAHKNFISHISSQVCYIQLQFGVDVRL